MAYSQAQLDALRQAIAQGVTTIEYQGKRITYRSLDEMTALEARIARDLAGTSASPRHSLAAFRRG